MAGTAKTNGKNKTRDDAAGDAGVVVKKYANRRLYNTATSSYVTLEDLSDMVKEGTDFVVYDAKSGEDITRSVLTQIIFEQESRGQNLLPITFLRRLIRFYGDSVQAFVPSYLEASMEAFARQQEEMRARMQGAWPTGRAMEALEDTARQNMAVFEQAARMFSPFSPGAAGSSSAGDAEAAAKKRGKPEDVKPSSSEETIEELRKQMTAMQARLDKIQGDA